MTLTQQTDQNWTVLSPLLLLLLSNPYLLQIGYQAVISHKKQYRDLDPHQHNLSKAPLRCLHIYNHDRTPTPCNSVYQNISAEVRYNRTIHYLHHPLQECSFQLTGKILIQFTFALLKISTFLAAMASVLQHFKHILQKSKYNSFPTVYNNPLARLAIVFSY